MSGSTPAHIFVDVSDDDGSYRFNPNIIHAANGTIISFRFSGIPGNHSVTQSTFATPCQPLAVGFDSGFIAARKQADGTFPIFNHTVINDQNAAWFYCRQDTPTSHCHLGMVGVINGVLPRFKAFQDKAEGFTNSSASPSSTSTSNLQHSKAPVPVGGIVGGTIGALTFIALLVFAFLLLRRRRQHYSRLTGMRPDPLIMHEKGSVSPTDENVSVLSTILREIRSLHIQIERSNVPPPPNEPPPQYTGAATVSP
ncbi:hypothetical protein B0H14DRAFT_372606 [Mycena olivaceomarginata]|nr:hypothetical protein B0H14DRAFT_372606 [Mycena olivaceomarginata]